jgi:biuret amidohydrolase
MTSHQERCLILLDMQNDLVHPDGKFGSQGLADLIARRGVLENTGAVLAAARGKGIPVAFVRVAFRPDNADVISRSPRVAHLRKVGAMTEGEWGSAIHESLAPKEGEPVFTKQSVNPFLSTNLATWLHRHGIIEPILAGVATNLVVEATARHCDDIGLIPTVLEDCCASPKPELHDFVVANVLPAFGSVTTSRDFLGAL